MSTALKSSVPLYAQLEAALREGIRRGAWKPGVPLPSDRELSVQWRVSRHTVRQALDALVRDGLVERRQGRGTFVVTSEPIHDFIGFYSFAGLEGEPTRLASRLISFETVDPPRDVTERLRVVQGVPVLRARILRLANDKPAILLTTYLPPGVCPDLSPEDMVAFPALTEVMATRCRIPVVSQRRSLRPTQIEGEDASLLGVVPGALGLFMDRVSYTHFRQPVECGYTLMRGDLCSYVLDLGERGSRSRSES